MSIREIRRELKLSQAEFARLLGVHQTAVSQWETGRTSPEVEMLLRIARMTGHTIDELMNADESRKTSQDGAFEMKMNDASMRGARIEEGDTVYFQSASEVSDGTIAAVQTEKGVFIRFVYRREGFLVLTAASQDFSPMLLAENARILGRAIAFRSAL